MVGISLVSKRKNCWRTYIYCRALESQDGAHHQPEQFDKKHKAAMIMAHQRNDLIKCANLDDRNRNVRNHIGLKHEPVLYKNGYFLLP